MKTKYSKELKAVNHMLSECWSQKVKQNSKI